VSESLVGDAHRPDTAASLSARNFAGAEQFEAFIQAISEQLLPIRLSTEDIGSFQAGVRSTSLGVVQLHELWARNAFVARRTSKLIASGDRGYLKVGVQMRGASVVSQGGQQAALEPGDFVLYDTTRPYQISALAPIHMQTLMFSRDALRLSSSQLERLTTCRISGREGLGFLVAQYLGGLARQLGTVSSGSCHLADATLDLLAAVFTERLTGTGQTDLRNGNAGLLVRVRTYIEHRLGDPQLDVVSIAKAHHVSVRTLQNVFASQEQTVTGWIRNRRIEHCRRDLANPAFAAQPVSSVAAKWGLLDPAHFSRLFKSTYGLSPRDYRVDALARPAR
jgi:AraC-like DNA-binding protein